MDARDAEIARLAEPVAGGHPDAPLRIGSGMFAATNTALGPHVVVKRAPIGCICCTTGVVFRASLLGLLHACRPARLIVDLGSGDHVAVAEAQLKGESLGRFVRMVGRVDLDASRAEPAAWP